MKKMNFTINNMENMSMSNNKEKNEEALKIEIKWQNRWEKSRIYEQDLDKAVKPFYNLMMFPYPSAEGLHVGNVYAYTGADTYGRFQRLLGNDVFEPIGFDAFGIHSENYAIKVGKSPQEIIKKNIKNFRQQLKRLGAMFDWSREVNTTDQEYYKWNQWLFLRLFKNGLAYKKEAPVNWCPSCKTVLSDEMSEGGKCERCKEQVVQKNLNQWFFKITQFAERLLNDHKKIDWSKKTIKAQKEWIRKSEGARIEFKISDVESKIDIFTTRADTLFGATYVVLAPEHQLIKDIGKKITNFGEVEEYIKKSARKTKDERIDESKEKTGVELKGIKAINPATKEEISIWISDYVLTEYGAGAIMAVPAHDQRDFEFAKKFNLPIKQVICGNWPKKICPVLDEAYKGEGHLVNSGKFTGMESQKAVIAVTEWLEKEKIGKKEINYKLRDWLISRQRYWGTPIPIIYCDKCPQIARRESCVVNNEQFELTVIDGKEYAVVPVSEKDLPIKLPILKNFETPKEGKSPLAEIESFVYAKCPNCGNDAMRETDTMDNFIDSSWYFMRYVSTEFNDKPFDKDRVKKWLPVNIYIGGNEHAVLHLMYTRFITKFLYDEGLINFDEPFKKFRAHGLLIKDGAKISKSRGNVINPDKYIDKYGADVFRMHLMFLGPYEEGGDFRDEGIVGIERFLAKVENMVKDFNRNNRQDPEILKKLHKTIKKVTEDIRSLQFNTAIASLMEFANFASDKEMSQKDIETFLLLLAPLAPHTSEELWSRIYPEKYDNNLKYSIHNQKWPEYDSKLVMEEKFNLIIQINGKARDKIEAEIGISEDDAKQLSLGRDNIKKYTSEKKIKKIIFVKDKLVNIVI